MEPDVFKGQLCALMGLTGRPEHYARALNAAKKSIVVNASVADVCERWLRSEELPKFMKSLGKVERSMMHISHSAISETANSSAASLQ